MIQMKEQDKNSEEDLSEVEIASLLNKGFKVMTVKMIKELRRRMDDQSKKLEVFKKSKTIKEQQNRDEEYNNWNEKYTKRKLL